MSAYAFILISALAQYAPASIDPPFCPAPAVGEPDAPQMLKPAPALAKACRVSGTVCVFAGGSDTYGDQREASPGTSALVLKRSFHVASMAAAAPPANQPWQVEIVARFKEASAVEPINVVLLDKSDPDAIANKEAILIWDVYTLPTKLLAMRFELRPEDGFLPGHSYLLRLVQTTSKSGETILADGEVNLD
jgi:hypothetical protein